MQRRGVLGMALMRKKAMTSMKKWLGALAVGLLAMIGSVHAAEMVTYYYTSPQGTVLATADAAGNVISTADYRPYGAQALGAPVPGPGYTGHVNDVDSGLTYMQARYYDPNSGRFLSVDPEEAGAGDAFAFGRYSYGSLNPIVNIDPDGRQSCVPGGCTVGPAPYNWFRDSFVGQMVGHTVGDPIALVRSDSFNPLTSQTLDKGQLQEAKLGILTLAMPASRPEKAAADVAKEIVLTLSKHGEAAEHVAAAIAKGHPDVLTINRAGTAANRQAATGGIAKVAGKDLDEYPPAMFSEGGSGASVRAINSSDNRAAGACIGNACRGLPDGTRVQVKVDLSQ